MDSIAVVGKTTSLALNRPWNEFAHDKEAITFLEENVFYDYMRKCRWFAGKARMIKFLKVQQLLNMPIDGGLSYLVVLHVGYTYGDEEKYAMPVSFLPDDYELLGQVNHKAFITRITADGKQGWLIDAIYDFRFQTQLFENIWGNAETKQEKGALVYHKGKGLAETDENMGYLCVVPDLEQSNSSLIYGNKYFFKLYRKLFHEINPEVEMLQFLTESGGFAAAFPSNAPARPRLPLG
jgi:hypothetical protein